MQASTKFTESYFPAEQVGELIEMTLPDLMLKIAGEVPDRLALVEGVADPATWKVDYAQYAPIGRMNSPDGYARTTDRFTLRFPSEA